MDTQLATQTTAAKLQKFEQEMTEILNGNRKVAALTVEDIFFDYLSLVKKSEDPDVKLKYLRYVNETSWPNVKQKDQTPQLPVFNINIDLTGSRKPVSISAEDVLDLTELNAAIEASTLTLDLAHTSAVNADIGD